MKLIIFGAGRTGEIALSHMGYNKIAYFVDNSKHGGLFHGKKIFSFRELQEEKEDFLLIIASENNYKEMEKQILREGIKRYLVFHESDVPTYFLHNEVQSMTYAEILKNYNVCKYRRIAIYGYNSLFPFLLDELALQNSLQNIIGVIDPADQYEPIFAIPKIGMENIKDRIDCLIINESRYKDNGIRHAFEMQKEIDVVDICDVEKFIGAFHHPELRKYRNIHKGKRAFIIGNGPSLRIEDLNTLFEHNEICFGLNKIYRLYEKTKWRPAYFCVSDPLVTYDIDHDSGYLNSDSISFWSDSYHVNDSITKDIKKQYVHLKYEEYYPGLPGFSDDITKQAFWGHSVTYDLPMQIAAYMGISEIYLLGIDHTSFGNVADSRNHGIENYFKKEEMEKYKGSIFELHKVERAYEKAEEYSKWHGVRIFNATRGGKLEVFERVEFDSLFG